MAATGNGRAKKPKKSTSTANGHINGHLNGHADKTKPSGPVVPSSKKTQGRPTISSTLISIFSRLTVWYLIATLLFRCPSSVSELSDESPRVCKPYLQARSHAAPYLDPYYQAYLAPQVDKVKPYVHQFDEQMYTPVSTFAKDKYTTYGAHRVEHVQKIVQDEWTRTVRPQLQNIQVKARDQYNQNLGPHVQKTLDILSPFYDQTKDSLVEIYHLSILPMYEAILPYARQGYAQGHHVTSHIIFPTVRSAQATVWKFISRTLWPQVRVLYGDNVEPQLVRIQARLGRYKDQQKFESAVESMSSETSTTSEKMETSSTFSSSTAASSTAVATPSGSGSGWGILDDLIGSDPSSAAGDGTEVETKKPAPSKRPQPTGEALRESLNEDLRNWQSKFATAADKGAEDLESRVAEITERQVENGVNGHGAALIVQLEETAESSVAAFKTFIKKTINSLPEDPTEKDLDTAYEKCVAKTRELGLSIKERAQAVRNWKSDYDQETDGLVRAAVSSTVEVLERIYSLGLQEVGMRWAWLDGVTYNDWQRYHKLRTTLTEWQEEVEAVGSQHDGLRIAHDEATKLEDSAIATASTKVSELVRLKEVAKWKIWAEDASDDFSDKKVPVRAFKATQQVIGKAQDASAKASEVILGSETPTAESIASAIQKSMSDASSTLSEAVMGSATPATESMASAVKSQASEASSIASEAIQAGEAAASKGPKKVFGGAMAQAVPEAKQAVFDQPLDDDDDETYSERISSMIAEAGDRASDLSRAVSEALLGAPKTQGTVESASSLASEQYAKALAAASSVLYGTKQPPMDRATSVAHEKFAQAVTAASYAIYGTPAPTAVYKIVQVQASSRYNDAISLANEQYANAKSQLSVLVSGTPKPAHETMFSMIEKAYSDSLAAASDKLNAALQYTDAVKSYAAGPTQGYFESVSSIASSRLAEGLSLASAQLMSQPTPTLDGARRQYYEAVGLAHARYSDFLNAASSAVYGPEQGTFERYASAASATAASAAQDASASAQSIASKASAAAESVASQISSGVVGTETPWPESVASQASQNWDALIAKASEQIYGAPTPWPGSLYSQAGAYAAQATVQAAEQYTAMQALISELVVGKEPDFTESVMSRFSSAYYTGIPAVVSSVNSVASDAYASASSVASSIFTPPPAIETILSQASEQLNLAVESASVAVYGTPKGTVERASESVASAYSSVQSQASAAIYGSQQAQDSFLAVANSAQAAISEAIFGIPTATGYAASATSGAGSVYSSMASVASVKAADAASAVSSAIYGPEQGAVESASSRLAAAVEAANSQISQLYAAASKSAEDAASLAASAATTATQRVKDEL